MWKIRQYQPGIFKNLSWEEWLNKVQEEEGTYYEIFQFIHNTYWSPAGTESFFGVILKKK